MIDAYPRSKNIGSWYGGRAYLITAGTWEPEQGCISYEIGIRETDSGKFSLLQGEWNHQSVQEVANAIASLLGNPTENYSPEWCMEHFK